MIQREQTDELKIPFDTFVNSIRIKILNYKPDTLDNFFSVPPYIQWDNIRLTGDEVLIEKSGKLFDNFSKYAQVSGKIYCKIASEDNMTILRAKIILDSAMADVMKYVVGFAIGLSGVTWLLLDFDFLILIGLILIETFIFLVTPKFQVAALDDLTNYYNTWISEATKE